MDITPQHENPGSSDPVRLFRVHQPRIKLHPLEKLLCALVTAQLLLLPWMLGTVHVKSQWVSFALAVAGFVASLIPRTYDRSVTGEDTVRVYPIRRLLRFPAFWLGLAFLGYIVVQALNPGWTYQTEGQVWWMQRLKNIPWLPAGMVTPFEKSNAWRSLLIIAAAGMPVCAVWVGFTRRRTFQFLLTALAINATLLAGLGMLQRFDGNGKVLWSIAPPASYFVSTFFYKNHAAAYFNLVLSLTAGLAVWHYIQGQRRMEKSSPASIFAFFGTIIAVIVLFSFSRTGAILMVAYLVFILAALGLRLGRRQAGRNHPVATGIILLLLGGFAAFGADALKWDQLTARFTELRDTLASDRPDARKLVRQATWAMIQDKPITGWGAGGYRFYFPDYQRSYPAITQEGGKMLTWEHAHNDYLETLAEVGILGSSLLLAAVGCGVWALCRVRFWQNPLALFGAPGLALTAAHALVDFPFQNPAILTTWGVLLWSYIRWTDVDR